MPSWDYLYDLTPGPDRCALFCMSSRTQRKGRRYDTTTWHENLLSTARSIERSNIFESVRIESYDTFVVPAIDDPEDIVIIMVRKGMRHEVGDGWNLYTSSNPTGLLMPFDSGIQPRARRKNKWLDILEAKVTVKQTG